MGIITAALFAGKYLKTYSVPFWVIICCHLAMGGGTMAGGWRIVKTMGQRITKLNPFGGFAAEAAGALEPGAKPPFWNSRGPTLPNNRGRACVGAPRSATPH